MTMNDNDATEGSSNAVNDIFGSSDEFSFDNLGDEELTEMVQNIRVESSGENMSLSAVMLDLIVAHNKLERYKKGSLALHKAVDERLQEEEKQNPDSERCEVLREVKDTAFGVYLRVQQGDRELHGELDGEYAEYLND